MTSTNAANIDVTVYNGMYKMNFQDLIFRFKKKKKKKKKKKRHHAT